MIFHCENPCIVCAPGIGGGIGPVDPSNPFLNLSSEAPDVDNFIGRYNTPGLPPLGQFFFAVGCVSFCLSDESQEEANLCAARQNVLCSSVNWPITVLNPDFPGPGQPPTLHFNRQVFGNLETTCTFTCPDGTLNIFTVPAGTILANNQATANAQAFSLCKRRSELTSICLSDIAGGRVCYGQPSNIAITSTAPLETVSLSGALPDGMSMSFSGFIITLGGTPTVGGDFNFSLSVTDVNGGSATKSYTLQVFGVTNSSTLTGATVGTPYVLQLNLDGTQSGVLVYSVVSGALPAGLTLNTTSGIISGTPTSAAISAFTVKIADSGIECLRDFTITTSSSGPDWSTLLWSGTFRSPGCVFTPVDGVAGASFVATLSGVGHQVASGDGLITYNGSGTNCQIAITVSTNTIPGTGQCVVAVDQVAPFIPLACFVGFAAKVPGGYVLPFSLPDTLGVPLQFRVSVALDEIALAVGVSGTVSNV